MADFASVFADGVLSFAPVETAGVAKAWPPVFADLPDNVFASKPLEGIQSSVFVEMCAVAGASILSNTITCDQSGGDRVRLAGRWPVGQPLEVYIGTTGTSADAPAYGGEGFGYRPQSLDGLNLFIVLPKVDFVGTFKFTVINPVTGSEVSAVGGSIVERSFFSKMFSARASFPPQADTGPRRIDNEAPL